MIPAEAIKATPEQRLEVLGHFNAIKDLSVRLELPGATQAFCDLALAVHELGLDWWITEAGAIHAGRSEDFRVWQVALALRVDVGAEVTRVALSGAGELNWQRLDEALVGSLIAAVAGRSDLAPATTRQGYWPDDYDAMSGRLVVTLTDGAIRNGYLKVPKLQQLFPDDCWGETERPARQLFTLRLPDGSSQQTQVLTQYQRIQARLQSLFSREQLKPGDQAVITRLADYDYQLTFKRAGQVVDAQASPAGPSGMDDRMSETPLNQILFGPPGTGKTYHTINQALAILAPEFLAQNSGNDPETRQRLKAEFDRFVTAERVRFVTFHQSFSYEDFVEGLRADSDAETGQVKYSVESGVFKRLCDDARTRPASDLGVRANPAIWKISINGTGSSPTKSYCVDNGEARIGWGNTGSLQGDAEPNAYYQSLSARNKGTLNCFAEQMMVGDILLCIHSAEQIGSIGVVTSDYRYEEKVPAGVLGDYQHVRSVRWLYRDINLSILPLNDGHQFTQKTVYAIDRFTWADLLSYLKQQGVKPVESVTVAGADSEPYVLIIDEINRGNVSRIFGELITLIEESKREGADEALSVKLPYSKKPFSVPKNVYLIGTMNTADRSLAGLDIALRRRFVFREMPPRPELLDDVEVAGLNIGQLLRVMNQRIEVLLDRDHCLGHAYFMPLQKDGSQARLELIFRNQILPLLQEYFFEDWQRIAWVLNDQRKAPNDQFIQERTSFAEALFGRDVGQGLAASYWTLNDEAFERMEAYIGILDASRVTADRVVKREAAQGEFTLRELASGSVEVWRADTLLQPAKPILRQLAEQLGVSQQNSNGNALNTRSLGRHLIDQLSQGKA